MNNSEFTTNEHYEFLQLNQLGPLSERVSHAIDPEEKNLRVFNAELLQRVGEYRKRNLELSESENALKVQLAQVQKKAQETERFQTANFETSIASLKREIEAQKESNQELNDEWTKRLTRLSDEAWARDLENETLRRTSEELQTKLAQSEESARILQATVDSQNTTLSLMNEAAHQRESQLGAAFETLRAEYADINRCYTESNAALVKLRSESREQDAQHEIELTELTTYLTEKAKQDSVEIRAENERYRELLSARDVRHEAERVSLEAWKHQLTQLDSQVRVFSEKLKSGKSELIRLSRSLESEIRFALANPFTNYLAMAELEIESLAPQIATTSALSPAKAKLEVRLQQAQAHRDAIKSILQKSESQLTEHTKSLQTVERSLEYLV